MGEKRKKNKQKKKTKKNEKKNRACGKLLKVVY
jgi:hypothetical protein